MKPSPRLKNIHFVGIGGAGMSGMAEVMLARGFVVSGSDAGRSEATDRLADLGARIAVGHSAANIIGPDVVVYSSAIPLANPELIRARDINIPIIRRAELLGELMKGKYSLAVAGTHGKTTTTTMLGSIFIQAGLDPTILAGGVTRGIKAGAVAGGGDYLIAEADEFDHSFLAMWPTVAVITNIDSDHLDCYGNLDAIRDAFVAFAARLPFFGQITVNADDEGVLSVLSKLRCPIVRFGLSPDSDYYASGLEEGPWGTRFELIGNGRSLCSIRLPLPGRHNVYNALGAAALALEEGVSIESVRHALEAYRGVRRRFEFLGDKNQISFYDDYAHHPTEIRAALQAARTLTSGRLIAVFQPHLYSRTALLHKEFAQALCDADVIFITGIYASRESPMEGVEGSLIRDSMREFGRRDGKYVETMDSLPERIASVLQPGDTVLTMGAGDIGDYLGRIMEAVI